MYLMTARREYVFVRMYCESEEEEKQRNLLLRHDEDEKWILELNRDECVFSSRIPLILSNHPILLGLTVVIYRLLSLIILILYTLLVG